MCGLAAIFGYGNRATPVDLAELVRIRDYMRARGPDGEGAWVSDDGRVALGHRRLAIIDLNERAAQPMVSADGRLRIVYNGEIYNYKALRAELERGGVAFRTDSDTEVLLHLYARDGTRMFAQLRGMYAFALWDAQRGELLLARDPYGIKPLYYADDGASIRVASQVKALHAGGAVSRESDPAGVVGLLLFGSSPEPFTCYRQVQSVPAGSFVRVGAHGVEAPQRHFNLAEVYRDARCRERDGDSAALARDALRDSVAHHMVADVPVGAFLSGGVDSGGILGLMRDVGAAPVRTATIAFEEFRGSAADEAPAASATAARYGADHVTRMVTEPEFNEDLPRILAAMDQPSVDGINSWFAAKACSERGLKVAVSGLGGDELLGSYPSFASLPFWVGSMGLASRIPLLGRAIRRMVSPLLRVQHRLSPKIAGMIEWGGFWEGAYLLRRGLFMPWELKDFLPRDFVEAGLERLRWRELVLDAITPDPGSAFARVACLESGLYLRNQLLRDTDWASMAHSLEVRTPLVDAPLVQGLAALRDANTPLNRKEWLANAPSTPLLPGAATKGKTGFTTPIATWLSRVPGFDASRRYPSLRRGQQHWSRHLMINVLDSFGLTDAESPRRSSAQPAPTAPVRGRNGAPVRIAHLQRKPHKSSYSVERIFADVRESLAQCGLQVDLRINRYHSKGALRRLADVIGAARAQRDVNHVTGDVHYLTYLLDRDRTVLTVLDCVGLSRLHGARRALLWLLWYWLPLRRCRYVTVISEFTRQELMREVKLAPERVVVIPPSLSDEFVHVPAEFDSSRPVVLHIGTTPNKNLARVVEALSGVSCRLVVIGLLNAEQRELLEHSGLDYFAVNGLSREQLRDQYARADLMLFASTYEGFGLPIIEANAVGRPVVTSNVCSMPEVAGNAACLVDPMNTESIRAGIVRVITDRAYRDTLVRNGLRNAERFRIPVVTAQYAELYQRVVAESTRTAVASA